MYTNKTKLIIFFSFLLLLIILLIIYYNFNNKDNNILLNNKNNLILNNKNNLNGNKTQLNYLVGEEKMSNIRKGNISIEINSIIKYIDDKISSQIKFEDIKNNIGTGAITKEEYLNQLKNINKKYLENKNRLNDMKKLLSSDSNINMNENLYNAILLQIKEIKDEIDGKNNTFKN